MNRLLLFIVAVVGVPLALVGYISLAELVARLIPGRRKSAAVRPWLWLAPAFFFLIVFAVYPVINTVYISFFGPDSAKPVGVANYAYVFSNQELLITLRNSAIWLVLFTLVTVTLGLVMAVLTDRVPYESVAKGIIFLPMAISFVAAGVIWKFMYDFRPAGTAQTGTLNAVLTAVAPGFKPQAWLINPPVNNLFLIVATAWVWVGFCMVILSAGLKGISSDVIEAGRIDGASEWQIFRRIIFPLLGATLAVVTTTMVIFALKTFDIVYVMTNGNYNTQIIAFSVYKQMFTDRNFGRAAAIAVILLLAVVPVMWFNLQRFREQEAMR